MGAPRRATVAARAGSPKAARAALGVFEALGLSAIESFHDSVKRDVDPLEVARRRNASTMLHLLPLLLRVACAAPLLAPADEPSVAVLKLRGQVFLELREYERAAEVFERARARAAEDPELEFALGLAHYGAGRAAEAEAAFERFVARNPGEAAAWPFLARLRQARGAFAEARDACDHAVKLDPRDARTMNLRGMIELDLELRDEALASFAAAIAADDAYAAPHFNVGMLALEDQDIERAVEEFAAAAALDPNEADACRVLGELHAHLEAFEEASRWYGRAVERRPADLTSWRGLALARERAGHVYEALEAWEAACALSDAGPQEFVDHARVLTACGDLDRATDRLQQALERAPDDVAILASLAQLAEDRGDAASALRLLRRLDVADGATADLLRRLSEQAEYAGDAAAARGYFDRLLAHEARSDAAQRAIAMRRVTSTVDGIRDLDDGYGTARARVAETAGSNAGDLLLLARAEAARGDHAAAAAACERAAELFESGSLAAATCESRAQRYRLAADR
jgi:tetratricopeptide (TPR) repeat protein